MKRHSMTRAGSSVLTGSGQEGPVLIGVGPDSHLSEGTIDFAATTATQLGLDVELLHVVPDLASQAPATWDVAAQDLALDEMVPRGQALLDDAVRRVRDRVAGSQAVHGQLLRGDVIDNLIEQSALAQLVVLEHRDLDRRERWGSGSVTAAVAARAHAPVVSVPASWRPSTRPRPITVAVEDAPRGAAEIWTALGLAAVNDAPVVVLRATYLAPAFEEMLRHQVSHEEMLVAARDELEHDVDLPAEIRERVPCTFAVRWGRPADVLVAATQRSSLLVVARRDPVLPFGSHLGPVLRHVLHEAKCPVLVVEPSPAPGAVPVPATPTAV
ncbi:universal stress protein [Nocardioides dilutus]